MDIYTIEEPDEPSLGIATYVVFEDRVIAFGIPATAARTPSLKSRESALVGKSDDAEVNIVIKKAEY